MVNEAENLSVADILGPNGQVANRLSNYELRDEQLQMAVEVQRALQGGEHLMIEAGTGVGKSFAYLVPAILKVTSPPEDPEKKALPIVVSTHTISLQEQLLLKDIPFLNSVIPREFSAVLVKGRGNYLSKRRLKTARERAVSLFDTDQEMDQVRQLAGWAERTADGSRSDLDFKPYGGVWEEVASDSGNCMGRKCPTYDQCFYYRARRRWQHSQLLIVNHALFFSDLALRMMNVKLLPDYQAVIFDEAHTLTSVASQHLGASVSQGQVDYSLARLYNDRTNKGLLVHDELAEPQKLVDRCRILADEFFMDVSQWIDRHSPNNGRVLQPDIVKNRLSPVLMQLVSLLEDRMDTMYESSKLHDYESICQRLQVIAGQLQQWLSQSADGAVYWVDIQKRRRGQPRIVLQQAPVDIGPTMRQHLFAEVPSVVMTSATLASGGQDGFDFYKSRIGLTSCRARQLGSPFDYRRQVKLVLARGMPDPNAEKEDYLRLSVEAIKQHAGRTDGRTFVLFTSYQMLRAVAGRLTSWLVSRDLQLYSQADGIPRGKLLDQFKENPRGVLLGTDSFWQGVDVPGDALKTVIIAKLPFSVPDHPLLAARLEAIRSAGGNPFGEFQIPEAVIKFRQGFGRLIRTQNDDGTVVVLDPRIYTKGYGKAFLASLPDCEVIEEVVGEDGVEFQLE